MTAILLCVFLFFTGCSGKGKGGRSGSGGTSDTAVISGKVTLSGTVLSSQKTSRYLKALYSVPTAKPGTKSYREKSRTVPVAGLNKVLFAVGDAQSLSSATVDLFDADHPEWLYPVSTGTTSSDGSYQLSAMTNAAKNEGAAYRDGDPIPAGKYTLVAYKAGLGQKPVVAVQTVVTQFEGTVPDVDFEVLDSDAAPTVISMLGLAKNTDGTPTWGSSSTTHPANAAILVTFSMPMTRDYLSAISLESTDGGTVPTGKWTLSADWLTASFYFDEGQTLTQDRAYKITIYGEDDTTNHAKVVNVYGNPIAATSTCTFKAAAEDTAAPTVQWNRPTEAEMSGLVDVTQPFRIESDELLDVNSLSLQSNTEPGIGVKPGVLFLGQNESGKYIYEFDLGEPLQLNTYYSVTIDGGKDLAGHAMTALTGSITTYGADDTPGIDPAADSEKQNYQAAVKGVFGKWVRAMSDRNLAQFQNMMSGEFYMEYDVSNGIDTTYDINRDGRYSFSEFSSFMEENTFINWAYCGTTITGSISSTEGTSINIYTTYDPIQADFDFKLSATNTASSQRCSEAAPKDTLYATLQYKNAAWKIVRASMGTDTRNKEISSPGVITANQYQINNADSVFSSTSDALGDGAKLDGVPNSATKGNSENIAVKYEWNVVSGVSTYVLVVMDERNPEYGVAVAFPATVTSARSDKNWVTALGGTDVSGKFGLVSGGTTSFAYAEGGKYYWEVIGLGTIASSDVASQTDNIILQDITAASLVREFNIAGVFSELLLQVRSTSTDPEISYSELFQGYNLGSSPTVTLTVYSPNRVPSGSIKIQGSKYLDATLSFDPTGVAYYGFDLYTGDTWVEVCDSGDSAADPPKSALCKSFNITTAGGLPPVIQLSSVSDNTGQTLTGDSSDYYIASQSATSVTITGVVTDTTIGILLFNLWNENGSYSSAETTVTGGAFEVTMDVYQGDNWISIYGEDASLSLSQEYVGIYAEAGATWKSPISVTSVSDSTLSADYVTSQDWYASPRSGYSVTITGSLKTPHDGSYYLSSDGGNESGTVTALSDGSFSLKVSLYDGWNYVSLYDSNGTWYGVNIYTTSGVPVIKPAVTKVNGYSYSGSGTAVVNGCFAEIQGTAIDGSVSINVTGYGQMSAGGYSTFWENQTVQTTGTGNVGYYKVTVPVASGTGSYTYVDIYDKDSKWTSMQLSTTSSCSYSAPSSTFLGVKDQYGTQITPDPTSGYYNSTSSSTVTLYGTSNRANYAVSGKMDACGMMQEVTGYASTWNATAYEWSITFTVYGSLNSGSNEIYFNDGSEKSIVVFSENGAAAPEPPLRVLATPTIGTTLLGCNSAMVDVGTATSVVLSGNTTAPNGPGYYTDQLNGNHEFGILRWKFSIPNVTVYSGSNNIYIYDTDNNSFTLSVQSSNTNSKPQFVTISSPNNGDAVSGDVVITGSVTNPLSSTGYVYSPSTVYAYVHDLDGGSYTYYSSDIYDRVTYKLEGITFVGTTFSFTHKNTGAGTRYYVDVYAYDNVNGINHGHSIYLNDTGSEYYYKLGAKPTVQLSDERKKLLEFDRMRRETQIMNKTR